MLQEEVDSQRLAERLAIGYLESKLHSTGVVDLDPKLAHSDLNPQYVLTPTKPSPLAAKVVDIGRGNYVPAPVSVHKRTRSRGWERLMRAIRPRPAPPQVPDVTVSHEAMIGGAQLADVYMKAITSQKQALKSYAFGGHGATWTAAAHSKAQLSGEVTRLLQALTAPVTVQVGREYIEPEAEPDRYVDEGLRHPLPARTVTLRAHLKPAGPRPAPFVHEPDSE